MGIIKKEGAIYFQTSALVKAIPENGEWRMPAAVGKLTGDMAKQLGVQVAGEMVRYADSAIEGAKVEGESQGLDRRAVERWETFSRVMNPFLSRNGDKKVEALRVLGQVRRAFLGLLNEEERKTEELEGAVEVVSREDIVWARRMVGAYGV